MKKEKIFDLPVYKNKRTGQLTVVIPKRKINIAPSRVKVLLDGKRYN